MIILCLDASTTAVGWALFDDGEYIDSGVYVPEGDDWVARVTDIDRWLWDNDLDFDFDAIGYELATGNRGNMHTNRLLGAVEYVVRRFVRSPLYESEAVDLYTVTASQVKASGCHKGNIQAAEWIVQHRHRTWCLTKGYEGDEADAIGVGLAVDKLRRENEMGRVG